MKFIILSENRDNDCFIGEAGLSIYLEKNENKFILDTGCSNLFLKHASILNINIDNVDTVVLTHGHNDHTGGLPYLIGNKRIIMHPECFKDRYSKRRKEYVGCPISKEELNTKHNLILTKDSYEIFKDIFYLGEIPMIIDFEQDGNFSTTLDSELTKKDLTEDDSGIAIKTNNGLVIMTGCGHRGICNTIEQAKKVTNENRIYAVLGGFHLRDLEKQKEKINKTIKYFEENSIKHLYLGHCITNDVIEYFKNNTNIEIHELKSGKEFNIE